MECYCYLRNIQDLLSDGKTPYERRFHVTDQQYRLEQWSNINLFLRKTGRDYINLVLGYAVHAGRIWKGDNMIADTEEFEEMDASELHARRLNAKEVLKPMTGDNFIFPVADGTVKTPGRDRRLRPSTLIRDHTERGEEQEVFRGESDELSSPNLFKMTITWNPESKCTCPKKNHFLFH